MRKQSCSDRLASLADGIDYIGWGCYLARYRLCPDIDEADQSTIIMMLLRFRDAQINIDEPTIKFFDTTLA
jgi:hypothetical protein